MAIAGYYPTPRHLIPRIAPLVAAHIADQAHVSFMDPCAGDGEAVLALIKLLCKNKNFELFACEMEATRFAALQDACSKISYGMRKNLLEGDAFCTTLERESGVSLLYLNPPYDLDRVHGRLENKFLKRFTEALAEQGVLLFVVPFYALKASAEELATHYDNVQCFKFPDQDFATFKQVVLFAQRVEQRFQPDAAIQAQVERYATGENLRELPYLGAKPLAALPALDRFHSAVSRWTARPVDVASLIKKITPWSYSGHNGSRIAVAGIMPDLPVDELMLRTYPVGTPPRPAHIASGIASGIFNGSLVTADDPALPALLVKGVFNQEYRTVEEKRDKKGNVTGYVQVQQPKLVVTALDLSTYRYHTLSNDGEFSGAIETLSVSSLLKYYGASLMRVMEQQCPILYDPRRDRDSIPLAPTARPLFTAQGDAARALVALLGGSGLALKQRNGKSGFLLGEIGSGKCLGLGTQVLRYDGSLVAVEDLEIGDLLMGPDNEPRRVLGTTRGVGPLYQITPTVGDPWVCNDAHILTLVHTMSDDVVDLPVQQLVSNTRLRLALSGQRRTTHPTSEFKQFFPKEGVEFPSREAPMVDPYFLGLWYGDGTKELKGGVLATVVVTTADAPIVSYLQKVADSYGLTCNNVCREGQCPTYHLSKGRFGWNRNDLLDFMRLEVSDGAHFPVSCLRGTKEIRLQFLAGLVDSDGYVSNKVGVEISQKREAWARDICFIAHSLGFRATMSKGRKSAYRGQVGDWYWRVCLSGDLDRLPTKLSRKKAVVKTSFRRNKICKPWLGSRRQKQVNRTGIKIHAIGEGEYAGFELDGDGRFLLGDFTVTHNTSVSLAVSKTVGAKRPLIICPPHLLKSWSDEITAVLPEAQIRILTNISELEALANDPSDAMIISVLSRETAKLGHGWESVGDVCPKCGAATPKEDHAKRRSRCKARPLIGRNVVATATVRFAHYLKRYAPRDETVTGLLKQRWEARSIEWYRDNPRKFSALPQGHLDDVIEHLKGLVESEGHADEPLRLALGWCLVAAYDEPKIAALADFFLSRLPHSDQEYGRQLLYLLRPGGELQTAAIARHQKAAAAYTWSPWAGFEKSVEAAQKGESYIKLVDLQISWEGGKLSVGSIAPNTLNAAGRALRSLTARSGLSWGKECGAFLFEAIPEPRRVALAKHIQKRFPTTFDFLIIDECHEYGTESSAQQKAAHRLTGLGLPTIQMSGSIMNGYAEHMFMPLWSMSRAFREEFARADKQRFIDRYGYRKRLLTERTDEDEAVVTFGSVSDRVTTTSRIIGNAPGILPLFLLRHLLPISVTLHKADLALDLPKCIQERHLIEPDPEVKKRYETLKRDLVARIKKDQFDPERAGKLFGQLAELPSYLDRATEDTGNNEHGDYVIRYPESVGGDVVSTQPGLPGDSPLSKERWMMETVERELAEGRNVMVFSWHVNLLPRIAGLLSELVGQKVPILYADKVPTAKRQEWITKNVVAKNARVMVCNPVTISTGLNVLTHFCTEIYLENPAANPIVYRQACGRVDRIGQSLETRILFSVYKGTLQEQLHELLMSKVAVSTATDGLDAESALLASGVGPNEYMTGLSIGKQLWAMMQREDECVRPVKREKAKFTSAAVL